MDFFNNPDWFNRSGPYAFRIEHIMFILLMTIIGFTLGFLLRKRERKTIKIVLISLWAFALAMEIMKYTLWSINAIKDGFDIEMMLPLHSCSMFMYIFPLAMFSKNKYVKTAASNFLVIVNMIMGYITMYVGCPESVFSFFGLEILLYHAIIFIVPLVMLITGYYKLEKSDIKWGMALFLSLAILVYIFDAITKCDYFFIYDGHKFGILYEISENVPHIVWTLIVMTCYILTALIMHYGIYYLSVYLEKRKQRIEDSK